MDATVASNYVYFENKGIQEPLYNNGTALRRYFQNNSDWMRIYFKDDEDLDKEMREFRNGKIMQFSNEISAIINHDEYIDGEESQSEIFMKTVYKNNQIDYVLDALMKIYTDNLSDVHILEGVLTMISSVPYDAVQPKGQIIAVGLLSNKELAVRDRAIQCFERWNSKKGLGVLRSLDCSPKWLQRYVDKLILYIERDGKE